MSSPVSSTPLLRRTLLLSAAATAALAVVGSVVGLLVAGSSGLWSALVAVLMAAVFLGLTTGTILIANRWYGSDLFVPVFFASVMGGWIVKFVIFLIVLFVLRGQPWLHPMVFLIALVVSIIVSLVIDVIVMTRMRLPHASDVTLPTAAEAEASERRPEDGITPRD
ncbi:hypothetical protein AB3M83_11700 [Microbacterium sp. 179-B 1A2 NHS]|uniref:hypothetical protein n=1 Tax=Microbacterium sp. 179-B 1A2 NHS TaxID=3142383 RepID=UPI00399F8AF5